jgi:predicted ATPase/class 3 adenylate cyclase
MSEQIIDNSRKNELPLHSPRDLITGTLTFLFTDIESSTHLWERHPELMREAMWRHDVLFESAVKQQAGRVVRPRGEGDSRFAVFPRATDALRAAVAIQRLFFAEPWKLPPLQVRIALHSGEANLRGGDYYGSTVNRCARLRSVAHGGQILMSQTTYLLVRDNLPAGVGLRDLGEFSLKDLERPEHIFQPVVAELPSDFPPLNTPDRIHNNLPLALTSFIGRQHEIEELEHLLWKSRLLTIAGPGGAGKTRLAIRLAQNVQGSFADGAWFVDLAPLSNCVLLSQYVMSTLGLREEAGYSPDQSLMDNLYSKTALLIFDNCEHLLPEVAQMAEKMLSKAPELRIIATSREKLGVPGEILWRIPPLSSPGLKAAVSVEKLVQYEAVKLFAERAAAARPGFSITPDNAAAVAKICARLDGIPLAIELAAARVRVLSVEEILARLDDRFHLLVGSRTALPRQQTLRALIDWSYDLLEEKERTLLRRLSVFAGSWTLEAAEQVCPGREMETWEVLDLLTSLVDKSFVIGETQNGHERYRFLETILKFSQERLWESQETNEFARRHAAYYLRVAKNSYGKMWGREQAHWLELLDEESDNLRAALDWLSKVPSDEGMMLQLTGSLWRFWEIRGYLSEGRSRLETALEKNSSTSDYWRANGLGGAGHLARQQGDYEQAKKFHEQSLSLFRASGDKLGAARQLNALGEIAQNLGDYVRAVELHEESLSLRREIGDQEGIAVSLRQLGVIIRDRGQYQPAGELLEESLRLERELGDKLLMALSLNDLGLVAHAQCDYERAMALFEEAVFLQRELNDRLGISDSLQNLGNVAKDQGFFQRAQSLYQECLELKKELGDKRGICRVIVTQAEIAFRQGKYPLAAELAGESLTLAQQLGLKREILLSLELQGFISYYQGNYERAANLAEETLALSKEIEAPRAIGYADVLSALVGYSQGNLEATREKFQEALGEFQEINDCRNIAGTYVHLARTAYRQGDYEAAMRHLEEGRSISLQRKIGWTYALVLEIMGLLQRSGGNYQRALELFQESLHLAVEQENQQGIANCLGALAGLAVMAGQARRATHLFAAAAKLRREMGAQMSSTDRQEYEHYLDLVHDHLDQVTFEAEWSQGFSMTTEQIIEELNEWSGTL